MERFSHSRLSTFENCPLAYRYKYIEHLKSDLETVEAFMGSRVHDALERLYNGLRLTVVYPKEDITAYYLDQWEKNWNPNILVVKDQYKPEHYRDAGLKAISDYYDRYHPFSGWKVVDTEMRVELALDEKHAMVGFIDRLDIKDKEFEIHDYKTSGHLPEQADLDSDRQLALYEMAVRQKWPDAKNVDLVWHYLVFDKEMRSKRTPEQLDALKAETLDLIKKVEAANVFPATPSALCNWCGYQDICPKTSHEHKVDSLPAEEYLKDDGVRLTNEYIEKHQRLKAAEEDFSAVEERVYTYAKKEGLETIKGSDHKLSVKFERAPSFPSKSKDIEAYEKFVKLLQERGVWGEVAQPNQMLLQSMVKKDVELADVLTDLVEWKEQRRITKSKLKNVE